MVEKFFKRVTKAHEEYDYNAAPRKYLWSFQVALFLAVTLMTAGVVVWATRPTVYTKYLKPQFVSYGSLLLCSSYKTGEARAKQEVYVSELEPWLLDADVFKVYLERNHVLEKIAERVKNPPLALLRESEWIDITPSFGEYRESEQTTDGPDYAFISGNAWRRVGPRPNRISVECFGRTPDESKQLAQATLEVVRKQFVETATRTATKQRKKMEQLLKLAQAKSARAEDGLAKVLSGLEPDFGLLNLGLDILEHRAIVTEEAIRSIQLQEAELKPYQIRAAHELQTLLEKSEQQRVLAGQIYLPDSADMRQIVENQKMLVSAIKLGQTHTLAAEMMAFRAKEYQLRRLLAEIYQEIDRERKRIPDRRTQLQVGQVSRELETWDAEILSLQKKVLAARIEEQRCKNSAITVILQEAMPGKRLFKLNAAWQERYRATLKYLPISLLGGAIGVALIRMVQELREVREQVERYCDVPVIAEIHLSTQGLPNLSRLRAR
jgi:hypothetical protein